MKNGSGEAWYVVDKDMPNKRLIVGQGNQHPRLYKRYLKARTPHWISDAPERKNAACHAKTRYRQPDQACRIQYWNDEEMTVEFAEPQRAMTPGQSVVFYQDMICLGGAIIEHAY